MIFLDFIKYYLDEETTPVKSKFRIKLRCTTTNQVFDSIRQAERCTGVKASNIAMVLKGAASFAGRDIDGRKMMWERIV